MTTDLSLRNSVPRHTLHPSITALLFFSDVCAVLGAYLLAIQLLAWMPFTAALAETVSYGRHRFVIFLTLAVIMLLTFESKGHYSERVPWWAQVQFILKATFVAFIVDGFLSFTMQQAYPPALIIASWLGCAALLIILRQASLTIASYMHSWSLPTVLLCDRETACEAFHALCADGETGYKIHTILLHDDEGNDEPFDLGTLPRECEPPAEILDGSQYKSYIIHHPDNFYLISLDGFTKRERDELIFLLDINDIDYALIPSTQHVEVYNVEPHHFFGNDFIVQHKRDRNAALLDRVCKRALDVAVSSVAIVVLAILTPVVFLFKRLEGSKTPVFYNGKRVGRDGSLFPCWKFCTMRADGDQVLEELLARDPQARAEWDKFQKLKQDPRIDSRISAFLRKTSLDELPQLWNVFVGDMSLVGPRPILPDQLNQYGNSLRHYTSVRPGLTGLWQVSGRNETTFAQRINWDSWYIRNWSVWNDIVILFKTVRVLFTGSGAY